MDLGWGPRIDLKLRKPELASELILPQPGVSQGGLCYYRRLPMRFLFRSILTASLAGLLLGVAASAVQLEGSLELLNRKGTKPARGVDARDAVIWWEPDGAEAPEVPEDGAEMVTRDKEFEPRVLIVTRGTEVRFPNTDPILHNVFSVSGENEFDLGLYRKGPGEAYTFEHGGVARVFCNVHHSMVGYVLVLETPHFVRPTKDGRFVLESLAEGSGHLVVWYERGGEPMRLEMNLPHELDVELSLKMTRARVPKHLNKIGRPYARLSDDY